MSSIRNPKSAIRNGFTLVELLIVIGIIVLLIGLLIPVVSRVKTSAQEADTKALLQALDGAIQAYYNTYRAYPGPIPNNLIANANAVAGNFGFTGFSVGTLQGSTFETTDANFFQRITGAENLVLGLCGGLRVDSTGDILEYQPSEVGQGPASINPANPKRAGAFIETKDLSFRIENGKKTGHFMDESGEAADTIIPEFLDRFTAGPMPVLYMRSRPGAKFDSANTKDDDNNGVINEDVTTAERYNAKQQYDIAQIVAYTGAYTGTWPSLNKVATGSAGRSIGQGKKIRQADYTTAADYLKHGLQDVDVNSSLDKAATTPLIYKYPYNAYAYLADPNASNTARQKDGYILISAGRDRVYGTNDDITNFGPVK